MGGTIIKSSPFSNNDLFDGSTRSVTGGVGVRTKSFFVDLAVVNTNTQSGYFPYLINGEGAFSKTASNRVNGIISIGFNFLRKASIFGIEMLFPDNFYLAFS